MTEFNISSNMIKNRPVVLSFSGHDPCGGAGIQADIETFISHQCHACSVITVLTEQDSSNVKRQIPQTTEAFTQQARTILNDFEVSVIKIGLIGETEIAIAIYQLLQEYPTIPVVFDPVLAAGGGKLLSHQTLVQTIVDLLLPLTMILTPNSVEARKLSQQTDLMLCGRVLLGKGCDYVLITGTHEQSVTVKNQLFQPEGKTEVFNWQRLPDSYHGSGCTLASAIAALIAHGLDPFTAILEAQEYTWNSLARAYQPGKGQHLPNRLFWMEDKL